MQTLFSRLGRHKTVMLSVAAMIALAVIYYAVRYRAQRAALQQVGQQVDRLEAKLQSLARPRSTSLHVSQLKRQIEERRRKLAAARSALNQQQQFASAEGPAAVQALNLKLSELAENSGVRIPQRKPYLWPTPPDPAAGRAASSPPLDPQQAAGNDRPHGPFLDQQLLRQLYGDSLQQFELETSFEGLQAFIDGLDKLPWPVVIVNLEINVAGYDARQTTMPLLKSTIVLAM